MRGDSAIVRAAESAEPTAVIIRDPRNNYRRPVFTEEAYKDLTAYLAREIRATYEDYKTKVWPQSLRNIKAFESQSDQGEAITLPFARRAARQQHAHIMRTMFAKDPVLNCKPLAGGFLPYYRQVLEPDPFTMQPRWIAKEDYASTEKFARGFRLLLKHLCQNRPEFRRTISNWVLEAQKDSTAPPLIKNVYSPQSQDVTGYALSTEEGNGEGPRVKLSEETRRLMVGQPNRWEYVSRFDYIQPLNEPDHQKSRWIAQILGGTTDELTARIRSGEFDFCRAPGERVPEDVVEKVLAASEGSDTHRSETIGVIDKREPSQPLARHQWCEVWFFWPVKNPDGSVEIHHFCGNFHLKSEELLNCYIHPYWFDERPFEPLFQYKRADSFSGGCVVEDVMPLQTLTSLMFSARLQNMAISNMSVIFARRDSSTFKFLSGQWGVRPKLRPGLLIPFDEDGDHKVSPLGTTIPSPSDEIGFLRMEIDKIGLDTPADQGIVPSRTPVGTVQSIQQFSKTQVSEFLDVIRQSLANIARRTVQIEAQYRPYGSSIPIQDERTKAIVEAIIHFPREMITDQFAFEVSATADDDSREVRFTQLMVAKQKIDEANSQALTLGKLIFDPQMPPPMRKFVAHLLTRAEDWLDQVLALLRTDSEATTIQPEELDALLTELEQYQQSQLMAKQQPIVAQQGGPSGGLPDAGAGAAIPESQPGLEGYPSVQPEPYGPEASELGPPGDLSPEQVVF